jgi:hypothetical protein
MRQKELSIHPQPYTLQVNINLIASPCATPSTLSTVQLLLSMDSAHAVSEKERLETPVSGTRFGREGAVFVGSAQRCASRLEGIVADNQSLIIARGAASYIPALDRSEESSESCGGKCLHCD